MTRSADVTIAAGASVLVIEDDSDVSRALDRLLRAKGYHVRHAGDVAAGRRLLAARAPDVVIADMMLPDGRGIEMASALDETAPEVPLVIMTGRPSVDSAVAALRGRAFDYLSKPFTDEELTRTLSRAHEVTRLRREVASLRTSLARTDCGIVGRSAAIAAVRERIHAVAPSPTTILITGETGVGKERVARALHELSGRGGRFVPLNCSSVPENLFEAELFGAKKGAYTGAVVDRPGLVVEASRGTLFLDEIGDMPPAVQPKVLRLLQERTFRALGADRETRADVRVLAATNRPLREMIGAGRFREDLYWRLAVVEIALPSLRERREDIAALAAHILTSLASRMSRPEIPTLSTAALAALERHDWPGNVRELENVLERAVLLAPRSRIGESDLQMTIAAAPAILHTLDEVMDRSAAMTEREYVVKVLNHTGGSITEAARLAGRNRSSFYRILKRHGLAVSSSDAGADGDALPH